MNCKDFLGAFDFINRFKKVDHLKALAKFKFSERNLEVDAGLENYYSERIASVIEILSNDDISEVFKFYSGADEYTRGNYEFEWKTKLSTFSDAWIPENIIMEAHTYELYSELLRRILFSFTSQLKCETLEIRSQPGQRWHQERYTAILEKVKMEGSYIMSPKVASILASIRGYHEAKSISSTSPLPLAYVCGGLKVYVDCFATTDYLVELPSSIVVTMDPDVYASRERNPEREFGYYVNRPFNIGFKAKSKLYNVVEYSEVQVELGTGRIVGDA